MFVSKGLTGRSDNKVDGKGRISIPASMKKALAPGVEDEVVISLGRDGQLSLFAQEYWVNVIQQDIMNRIESASDITRQQALRKYLHTLSEHSHTSKVDGQGRITVPQWLLEKAGIGKDAVIIGAADRATVWSPERYAIWMSEETIDPEIYI